MTCKELDDRLDDYLSGDLSEAVRAELERHLGGCRPCLDYLASYRRTIRAAKSAFADQRVPTGVRPEVLAAILAALRRSSS